MDRDIVCVRRSFAKTTRMLRQDVPMVLLRIPKYSVLSRLALF